MKKLLFIVVLLLLLVVLSGCNREIERRDHLIKNFNSFEVFRLDDGLPYRYLIRDTNGAIWLARTHGSGKLESKVIIFPPRD